MKIFFVCQRVPFPPNRGDKITTFNELRYLSQEHEVHVFCLADGAPDLDNVAGARQHACSVTAIPVDRTKARLRAARSLLLGRPMSVAMLDEAELHSAIRKHYADARPELIFVYSSNVAQYAEPFADTARIMQFADLDSVKFASYADVLCPPMSWVYGLEGRRLLAYEQHIASTFSHSIVCTEVERRDFQRLIPDRPVSVVGNGVDLEYFRPSDAEKIDTEIVFTGVMDYYPNVEAVRWFCNEIFPLIRQRVAQAHFTICGSRPTPAVLRLSEQASVTVTGWVEDIRPYLERAAVFVAPLRVARGIQNKVIESLAMGLPVVASRRVCAGTGIPDGEGILAADEPSTFADHVVRVLIDDTFRSTMSLMARRVVEQRYTWEAQIARLQDVLHAVTRSDRPARD